jgi:hypothetical protein
MPINSAATMPVTTKPAQRPMPSSASQKYKYTWVTFMQRAFNNNTSHVASPAPHVLSYPSLSPSPALLGPHSQASFTGTDRLRSPSLKHSQSLCEEKERLVSVKRRDGSIFHSDKRKATRIFANLRTAGIVLLLRLSPTQPLREVYDFDVSLLYTDIVPWAFESIQVDFAGGTFCYHATLHM